LAATLHGSITGKSLDVYEWKMTFDVGICVHFYGSDYS